jgi:hypothetical protein
MERGTTFYFVTGGIEEAQNRAKQATGTKATKIWWLSIDGTTVSAGQINRLASHRVGVRSPRRRGSTVPCVGSAGTWVFGDRP